MTPEHFVAEVYRRMYGRYEQNNLPIPWAEAENCDSTRDVREFIAPYLPESRAARLLEIGFGRGYFVAAALSLGYTDVTAADFGANIKPYVREWAPDKVQLEDIKTSIIDYLRDRADTYDFIYFSHVIEHIPKYSLLTTVDALYAALRRDGRLFVRTPNMEAPCALSCLYVTLGHEYGFAGSNLVSLLEICNFDDVHLIPAIHPARTLKQRMGALIRKPILLWTAAKHRMFGVNDGGRFEPELIACATRKHRPPLFEQSSAGTRTSSAL